MNHNTIDVVVQEIPADVAPLFAQLSDDERDYASQLSARRQREWVTWRALLRANAERWGLSDRALRVAYAPSGAPIFEGFEGSISVTHSSGYVALAHVRERRCGVDIEHLDRRFEHVETKYISAKERALPEASDERFRAVVWCAKEAMFKYLGREGVDFKRDMQIRSVDFVAGSVEIEAYATRHIGTIRYLDNAVLVAFSSR